MTSDTHLYRVDPGLGAADALHRGHGGSVELADRQEAGVDCIMSDRVVKGKSKSLNQTSQESDCNSFNAIFDRESTSTKLSEATSHSSQQQHPTDKNSNLASDFIQTRHKTHNGSTKLTLNSKS